MTVVMMSSSIIIFLFIISQVLTEILRLPACGKFDLKLSVATNGMLLKGAVINALPKATKDECYFACAKHIRCKSVNIHDVIGCELNSKDRHDEGVYFVTAEDWTHLETPLADLHLGPICKTYSPCYNGKCRDVCQPPGYTCTCTAGFTGQSCDIISDEALHFSVGVADLNFQFYPTATFSIPASATGLTLCAWIKATEIGKTFISIFEESPSQGACNYPVFEVHQPDRLDLVYQSRSRNVAYGEVYNCWTHACFSLRNTNDGHRSGIYINGMKKSDAVDYPPQGAFDPMKVWKLVIGNDVDNVNGACKINNDLQGFIGLISQLNIWSREMLDADIQKIYRMQDKYADSLVISWKDILKNTTYSEILMKAQFELNMKTLNS